MSLFNTLERPDPNWSFVQWQGWVMRAANAYNAVALEATLRAEKAFEEMWRRRDLFLQRWPDIWREDIPCLRTASGKKESEW